MERRLKILYTTPSVFPIILSGKGFAPLPDDAVLMDITYSMVSPHVSMVFWSSEWDIVPPDEMIPVHFLEWFQNAIPIQES